MWCLVGFINILSPSTQCELCFTLTHPSPLSVCLLLAVKSRLYFALFVPQRLPPTFSLLTVSAQKHNTGNHMWNRTLWASQCRWMTQRDFFMSHGSWGRSELKLPFLSFQISHWQRYMQTAISEALYYLFKQIIASETLSQWCRAPRHSDLVSFLIISVGMIGCSRNKP